MPVRRKEGSFIEIALPNGKYAYGRILPKAAYAFYNIYSDVNCTDLNKIKQQKILFIIAVYKSAITKGIWKSIGVLSLEPALQIQPFKFIEDQLVPGKFELYNPNTGEIKLTTKDKCIGLERAAIWEPAHVEERIIAHFERVPSKWVEQLKLK